MTIVLNTQSYHEFVYSRETDNFYFETKRFHHPEIDASNSCANKMKTMSKKSSLPSLTFSSK